MKAEFDTASFKRALGHVLPAVRKVHTLPILSHIRVRLGGIDGSNLSMQITAPVDGTGDPLNICVPADRLKAAVSVAGDKITFTEDRPGIWVVKAGRSRFTAQTLPGEYFPLIDETEPQTTFQSTESIGEAIERVAFASAKNDVRFYLNGVYLECDGRQIEVTATDGNMLATMAVAPHHNPFGVIIPNDAAGALAKVGPATWMIDRLLLLVESDDARIVVKGLDGKYPDWRRLMSGKNSSSATIPRQDLVDAVSLSRMTRDESKNRPIKLKVEGDVLRLHSIDVGAADITTEIEGVSSEGPMLLDCGFNGDLLEPLIKAVDEESITLAWDGSDSAYHARSGNFRAAIMPYRV